MARSGICRPLLHSTLNCRFPPATASQIPVTYQDITIRPLSRLGNRPEIPTRLADLVKFGFPPLTREALIKSANFTLARVPERLIRRIQAIRNLPFVVVSNPHISRIHATYIQSLKTLTTFKPAEGSQISTLEDEIEFTNVLTELVRLHSDTIPYLARGFLECRKYMSPEEVTQFLDEHLRARIETRLIAEQHIALHNSSTDMKDRLLLDDGSSSSPSPSVSAIPKSFIGVIDASLRPAVNINECGNFVAEICEAQYGVRPNWVIDGEPATTFAFVPMHLDYMLTELLKNSFRATVEAHNKAPVQITIAPAPMDKPPDSGLSSSSATRPNEPQHQQQQPCEDQLDPALSRILADEHNAPGVTIRIRDRGGGIPQELLQTIWSYSFSTFGQQQHQQHHDMLDDARSGSSFGSSYSSDGSDFVPSDGASSDPLIGNILADATAGGPGRGSSIAGLGYGLPLSRAYAEYFGGGIEIQSLPGWGVDVYVRLNGLLRRDPGRSETGGM